MHTTAMRNGKLFFERYAQPDWRVVIDSGAMDVNGSLRSVCPQGILYIGADTEFGKSVDIRIDPHEGLPFREGFADCIVSSSQMEHDDFFWMTFLDYVRVVREGGLIYINAPSNGAYHRYPSDNWRFYPDAGHVLVKWARRNGLEVELVESFVSDKTSDAQGDVWCDFVAVFVKGVLTAAPARFIADEIACRNVWKWGATAPERVSGPTHDEEIIRRLAAEVAELKKALAADEASDAA